MKSPTEKCMISFSQSLDSWNAHLTTVYYNKSKFKELYLYASMSDSSLVIADINDNILCQDQIEMVISMPKNESQLFPSFTILSD